ncbi:MAG: hypothetical protein WBK28_01315 [Minisyncoccia bacterium]
MTKLKTPYGFLVVVEDGRGESRFSFVESETDRGAYELARPRGPALPMSSVPSLAATAKALSLMRADGHRLVRTVP